MLLNCGVGEGSWESLGQQGDPVHPKRNQSWYSLEGLILKLKLHYICDIYPILWPPDAESHLIGKDPDVGKDWRQEEKETTEDGTVGRHHQLNGHKFEQTLGDGEGQGSLACCNPWARKELDVTEWTNKWWNTGKLADRSWWKCLGGILDNQGTCEGCI